MSSTAAKGGGATGAMPPPRACQGGIAPLLGYFPPGTDLGGFQGAKGTPWAPQGVPETPCGFGPEEFLKCFYCQMRLPQHFLLFHKKYNYFLVSQLDFYNFFPFQDLASP